jgi:hypothetical protein
MELTKGSALPPITIGLAFCVTPRCSTLPLPPCRAAMAKPRFVRHLTSWRFKRDPAGVRQLGSLGYWD